MLHHVLQNLKNNLANKSFWSRVPQMFSALGPPVPKTATDYGYLTFKRKTIKDLKTGSKNIFVINFENKGFDKIHVSSLFCCQDVISIAWAPQTNGNIPVHAMKLTRTIRIKVLNYRDAVQAMSLMTNAKMSFANKHLLLSL